MRKVTIYPVSVKENILAKALAPNPKSIVELTKEFNVPYNTIRTWVKNMIKQPNIKQKDTSQRPQDKSAQDKLRAVMDTLDKTELERGAYCREHGIYIAHLDDWREQTLEALRPVNSKQYKNEHKKITNEIKQLKRDLQRKDKALAEVSALLILKKKAEQLWGEQEDD